MKIQETNWIGKKFNYLTIVEKPFSYYDGKRKRRKVKCLCECGNIKETRLEYIKKGTTKSCGCFSRKLTAERSQKYTANYNFFDNINNPKNAYCLGLWCADGCVHDKNHLISIEMIDLDIIEKVKKCLGYTGLIEIRNLSKGKTTYYLRITSLKLHQNLIKWGCLPHKSYCLEFPKVGDAEARVLPHHLMDHWIRGIFDGDGCLFKCKNGCWGVTIAGTKNICEGLKNYLGYGNIYLNCTNPKNNHETWVWQTNCKSNVKIFLNYIYKDATIYLERKFQKYQEYLKSL